MSTARQRRGFAGVSKLRKTLRRLEPEMVSGIKDAIKRGAQAIEYDMLIGISKDTGETAQHISYKISRDGFTAQIGFVGKKAVEQGYAARFIEYGTKGYAKKNIPPQAATPFMQPAFDSNKNWITREVRREVKNTIDKVAQGDGSNE